MTTVSEKLVSFVISNEKQKQFSTFSGEGWPMSTVSLFKVLVLIFQMVIHTPKLHKKRRFY